VLAFGLWDDRKVQLRAAVCSLILVLRFRSRMWEVNRCQRDSVVESVTVPGSSIYCVLDEDCGG
jgi:hypothetical protein